MGELAGLGSQFSTNVLCLAERSGGISGQFGCSSGGLLGMQHERVEPSPPRPQSP
jgi:hypothetical protein